MTSASPLARFPLVRTTSAEETRAALSCTYAKPNMEFTDREQKLQTVVNLCQLVDVGLVYASCAASLRFEYPETDLASQIFSIDGRCEVMTGGASVAIRPDCGVVISPGESLQITSSNKISSLGKNAFHTYGPILWPAIAFQPQTKLCASFCEGLARIFLFSGRHTE
jgi:hypothetical protein